LKNPTKRTWLVAAAALTLSWHAQAVTVLTFEGVGNLIQVGNFYNGGAGGNLGISFGSSAVGLVDSDAGGTGNFGGEPSSSTALFFLTETAATMNVSAGFTTGFSFFYSAPFDAGVVKIYSGLNASGSVLATLNLPMTPNNGAPDPTGTYSPFLPLGVTFSGTAFSVDFGGTAQIMGFDNITIGSQTAVVSVPDTASTLSLLSLALSGLGLMRKKLG
jgi:hypothetical protein